jgi:hypothetical protein
MERTRPFCKDSAGALPSRITCEQTIWCVARDKSAETWPLEIWGYGGLRYPVFFGSSEKFGVSRLTDHRKPAQNSN